MIVKKAIYVENVNLGDDDVMKSNGEGAVFDRRFVKDMSKYVQFPEEEQKKTEEIKISIHRVSLTANQLRVNIA